MPGRQGAALAQQHGPHQTPRVPGPMARSGAATGHTVPASSARPVATGRAHHTRPGCVLTVPDRSMPRARSSPPDRACPPRHRGAAGTMCARGPSPERVQPEDGGRRHRRGRARTRSVHDDAQEKGAATVRLALGGAQHDTSHPAIPGAGRVGSRRDPARVLLRSNAPRASPATTAARSSARAQRVRRRSGRHPPAVERRRRIDPAETGAKDAVATPPAGRATAPTGR